MKLGADVINMSIGSDNGFTYDESLLSYLVKKSYSQTYGARNLRRQIQKDLEDPIATKIIDSYMEPVSKITISVDGENLAVNAE